MNRTGSTPPRRARCFTAAAAVALAFAGAPGAVDASDDVYACVNNASGQTQIVSAGHCLSEERHAGYVERCRLDRTGRRARREQLSGCVGPLSHGPAVWWSLWGPAMSARQETARRRSVNGRAASRLRDCAVASVGARRLWRRRPARWTGLVRLTDAAQPVASVTMRLWAICAVVQ